MAENLREQLIGAWKLVSYQEIPVDGSDPFEPLGHQPRGLIIYTPDGYMSASSPRRTVPTSAPGTGSPGRPTITPRKRPPTSPTRDRSTSTRKSNP